MYWKIEEYTDELDIRWIIYNYFDIIKAVNSKPPFYNGITKQFVFTPDRQVVIKACIFDTEEGFLEWYNTNIKL
jgi:hypothetical protein